MTPLIAIHTLISLAAIVAGAVAMPQLFQSRLSSSAITVFMGLAVLTSVSGFFLPYTTITPALVISILALAILAVVLFAQRKAEESRLWRLVFVGGVVASIYLLVFVGVVQAFMKIGPLHAVAPTQSEAPFIVAQTIALLAFIGLGVLAARSFRPSQVAVSAR